MIAKDSDFATEAIISYIISFLDPLNDPYSHSDRLTESMVAYNKADLLGMQIWGQISDKVRNMAVNYFGGWFAIFLPISYVFVGPRSILLPILLHLLGGSFWSGINLCMNNLLLGISPEENKAFYLSAFNISTGIRIRQ